MNISLQMTMVALLATASVSCSEMPFHGDSHEAPATISMRDNDFALCGQEFWDDLYALTVDVFAIGAANVGAEEYAEQVFALVRSSKQFEEGADEFIDHIRGAPAQLVQIIDEDPTVLDSCANFSVALVGPP